MPPDQTTSSPEQNSAEIVVGAISQRGDRFQFTGNGKKKKIIKFDVKPANLNGAKAGDVVALELSGSKQDPVVKVKRILGKRNSPGILSSMGICERGLREDFSAAAQKEAAAMKVPGLEEGREDLRHIPLVTVDGDDSRDFDDAIFAEPTKDGGYHLLVAIADVSYYVRPGSALDKEAYERGNSTYLPDRVLPMLPEVLSNGVCSLKPHEDRACMAFHLYINKEGELTGYQISRGLMKSAARLTYNQLQAAKDGNPDETTAPLMDNVVKPLYAAYEVLKEARKKRGSFEMNMPEYKIVFNKQTGAPSAKKSDRPESCKVIEEFMILTNVAAPTAALEKNIPFVYRTHGSPACVEYKLDALRDYLEAFGYKLPDDCKNEPVTFGEMDAYDYNEKLRVAFNDILTQSAKTPSGPLVAKAIILAQAKARYTTENIGHFGLALDAYAHVTSPIRRYEDLLDHRILVKAFNLGSGAISADEEARLDEIAAHISTTEVVSAKAEGSTFGRYASAYLEKHRGEEFTARISGVCDSGIFVKLEATDTEGFLPVAELPKDVYKMNRDQGTMTGENEGRVYRVGATMQVRVISADKITAGLVLKAANDNSADIPGLVFKPKKPKPKAEHKKGTGPKPGLK